MQPHSGTRRTRTVLAPRPIDFMIAHPELQAQARQQEIGPADRDLVLYRLAAPLYLSGAGLRLCSSSSPLLTSCLVPLT